MNKIVDTKALLKGKRSVWKDAKDHVGTCQHGKIIPVFFKEMLPGDQFVPSSGLSLRMNPLNSPVFDDIYGDVFWFWVPYRIIWNQAKQFFGENDVSAWTRSVQLELPHGDKSLPDVENKPQSLFDYIYGSVNNFSVGVGVNSYVSDEDVNDLPLRAYIEIYNYWFRNQNVTAPILYNKDFTSTDDNDYALDWDDDPLTACRFHDIAETLLPAPQKGTAVTLGLNDYAPLKVMNNPSSGSGLFNLGGALRFTNGAASLEQYSSLAVQETSSGGSTGKVFLDTPTEGAGTTSYINYSNLVADLTQASAVTIQDLYYAECLQRMRYLLGVGGSRYQEYNRTFFGVVPNAEVLDYPELLSSHRFKLNISQVVSHSETQVGSGEDTNIIPIGEVAGMSWTNDRQVNCFNKFCQEHGIIMAVMVMRHPTTYYQAIQPYAFKRDLLDVYCPPFANIYDVPFATKFIWPYVSSSGATQTNTLGFAEPWWDYKHEINQVSGYLNPGATNALKTYSLARGFVFRPTLDDNFVFEDRNEVIRVTAGEFGFDYMFSFHVDYTIARKINLNSVPGDIIGKLGF